MRLLQRLVRATRADNGSTLPELLVGSMVTAVIMVAISSVVFTATSLQRAAADRNAFAASVALVSLVLDRDGAMADAAAPARTQVAATSCSTEMNLGFVEGGSAVRLRTVAAASDGPSWLERVSGAGSRTIARNVSSCTWRAVQEATGRWTLRLDLTLSGPSGESVSQTLRAAPRLW